ncbi:hypothetical protein ACVW0P_002256 [Mucilaginibacter sp. UYNi724]
MLTFKGKASYVLVIPKRLADGFASLIIGLENTSPGSAFHIEAL